MSGSSRRLEQHVDDLAVAHRAKVAKRTLIAAGSDALPAVRDGLRHTDVRVVIGCIDVIDHVLDETALGDLFGALEHCDSRVRGRALHALTCEHCKQGDCRPSEAALRRALIAACDDLDAYVRLVAVEGLSAMVHDWDEAFAMIVRISEFDTNSVVRKKAALAAPGGPIYEGRRSKSGRLRRRPPSAICSSPRSA
jgi:HEAT repeat protein